MLQLYGVLLCCGCSVTSGGAERLSDRLLQGLKGNGIANNRSISERTSEDKVTAVHELLAQQWWKAAKRDLPLAPACSRAGQRKQAMVLAAGCSSVRRGNPGRSHTDRHPKR